MKDSASTKDSDVQQVTLTPDKKDETPKAEEPVATPKVEETSEKKGGISGIGIAAGVAGVGAVGYGAWVLLAKKKAIEEAMKH